ncbi:MAG: tRNA 2-thiouridine(34) synthase MnmA [Clostridia bacterium]|nr:tRNA 2-thiouridine(34) synthase MnmA [Clostridia bacterium]
MSKKRVVVGISGGVDSSVAAYLLKEQGYDVVGLFMRNWKEEDDMGHCTAEADYADALRVCGTLDIPFYTADFSKEYWERVFLHFVEEYKKGRTPNPDVLCNREIKFKPFLERAKLAGADYVATGHYCGVKRENGRTYLTRAKDENKDQTYFLNQLSEEQIKDVLFPLQDISDKSEVRRIAEKLSLVTADKKDSTGICFIGERKFREFLSQYIPMQEGDIVCDGKVVGRHQGVFFYTLGQRKGLGIGGEGERWFVTGKDVQNNILFVSHGEDDCLFKSTLTCESFNWINGTPTQKTDTVTARIRHRQPLQDATYTILPNNLVQVDFSSPQRAIAEGQYCVLYKGEVCLGGGVIG